MTTTAPPGQALQGNFARELPELATSWQAAEAPEPRLLALNTDLAHDLGLDPDHLRTDAGLRFLVGTELPEGATPVAQAYAGHQFGQFVPRLGDGRALLLGELTDTAGHLRDLHLKGSGPTPFSRGGDGWAAVGPMLREFIISEALHALDVPTTRSLAVVGTGRAVQRERPLPGAVLARVAASHLRVGSFQYARATGDEDLLRRLADHAIARHHPQAAQAENPYLALFEAVLAAQADLVAKWMGIGFVHGVMNTDNTTISGQSIDYGPCAFMEGFDPATVFSSIDARGRYAYGNQPAIIQWNLARFAETLLPLLDADQDRAVEIATEALGEFPDRYRSAWVAQMRTKLGLPAQMADDDAASLADDLTSILAASGPDFTTFFRRLTQAAGGGSGEVSSEGDEGPVRALVAGDGAPLEVAGGQPGPGVGAGQSGQGVGAGQSGPGVGAGQSGPGVGAGQSGPAATDAETLGARMQAAVDFSAWLRRWRAADPDPVMMARTNPVYIPRNHLVDEALQAATTGDLAPFEDLLAVITQPYTERSGLDRYEQPAPADAAPFITYCGT